MPDFLLIVKKRIADLEALDEFSRDSTAVVELDQTRQGRLSRIDAMQGQEMAKAGEQRRQVELQRLRAALGRLERGDFGDCVDCGEAIGDARLEADPATKLCLGCAGAREARKTRD